MANNLSLGIVVGASTSSSVGSVFHGLEAQAASLGRSLQQVRLGRAASDDVIRFSTQLNNLNTVQRSLGGSNTYLAREIAGTEQRLRTATTAAQRYGVNLGDIINENRRLVQSERVMGAQLQRTQTLQANRSRRSELGGQVMGTIGMAMMAAAPIKAAADFETGMLDVRESIKLTDAEFNSLGKSILHISATMPMAASGVGEIVAQAGKLGIAKDDIAGFTQDVIKMSVALDMSAEEAGGMMAHWRTAMGLSQQQAVLLGDAVNTLGDTMNVSGKDIAEVVRKEGAFAMAAGFTAQETAALSAALLNSGTPAKQAGMALKNITNTLSSGEHATKKQAAAFEELGLQSDVVAGKMKTNAVGAFQEVLAVVAKLPTAEQGGVLGRLFGPKSIEPMLALIAHSKNLSGALDTVAKSSNYAGANAEEYAKKSQSTANQLKILGGAVNELEVEMGTAFLPVLKTVVSAFSTGGTWLSDFSNKFPVVTQAVAALGIGLAGLKVAILAGSFTATLLSDAWVMATGAMAFFTSGTAAATAAMAMQKIEVVAMNIAQGAMAAWTATCTTAQWLWNAALSANPIGLVVIGITAFGALAFTVYKNWEPIMAWFRENFAWLGTAVDKVKGYADQVGGVIGSVGKLMTTPVFGAASAGKGAALGAAMAATAAVPALAGNAPQTINNTHNTTIHVSQKAGEDSNALAERIAKHIDRAKAKDARGALHD